MIIPIATDRPLKRRPVVNETLITINLLVYLAGVAGQYFGVFSYGEVQFWGQFDPRDVRIWQLVTYQFMHDPSSIWHLVMNMLFLWIFGNAVEDRLGRVGYLAFFLGGGAVAGLSHGVVESAPVIGASGSVAAVSGAFLALFPRAKIKVIFFLFGLFTFRASWFILFYFAIDFIRQVTTLLGISGGNVAYAAHLAGYLFGFGLSFMLLATGALKREEFDIFFLFKQMQRRRAFRSVTRETSRVWDTPIAESPEKEKQAHAHGQQTLSHEEEAVAAKRSEISRLLAAHRPDEAANLYMTLLQESPTTTLSERRQQELANHLYQREDFEPAAQAYENLLRAFPSTREAAQVKLMLGLLYTRRLGNPTRARALLEEAMPSLRDDEERALATSILESTESARDETQQESSS